MLGQGVITIQHRTYTQFNVGMLYLLLIMPCPSTHGPCLHYKNRLSRENFITHLRSFPSPPPPHYNNIPVYAFQDSYYVTDLVGDPGYNIHIG